MIAGHSILHSEGPGVIPGTERSIFRRGIEQVEGSWQTMMIDEATPLPRELLQGKVSFGDLTAMVDFRLRICLNMHYRLGHIVRPYVLIMLIPGETPHE